MRKILFTSFLGLALAGCGRQQPCENYAPPVFPARSVPQTEVLRDSLVLYGSGVMALYKDWLIVASRHADGWVHFFDKHTGERIGMAVPPGKGPGEAVQVSTIDVSPANGRLFVTDRSTYKILEFDLDSLIRYGKRLPEREFTLPDSVTTPIKTWHTADGILSTGSRMYGQARLVRFHDGICTARYDTYPAAEDTALMRKSYVDCTATVSPDGSKMAFGLKYGCILEILDLRDGGIRPYAVRYFHKPEMAEGAAIGPNEKTVFGFGDISSTDRYIYGTYRGTKEMDAIHGIAVFDWDGNERHFYQIDKLLIDFCVEPDDSVLYAVELDTQNGEFRLVSIPLEV